MYSGKSRQDVGMKMFAAGSMYDPDDAMLVVFKQGCKKFCVSSVVAYVEAILSKSGVEQLNSAANSHKILENNIGCQMYGMVFHPWSATESNLWHRWSEE